MHWLNRLGLALLILECWGLTMRLIEFIHKGNKPNEFEATATNLFIIVGSVVMLVWDWEWMLNFWIKGR